ncbi:hypothetical protein RRG08_059264 [Elysia crispata]|uniref:Uncharacterized protein n=1 Tax=Elysia crispata TaxID=231223 RepID=A0AAE0Y873_9GAST|nr:hypothetical protein RRG08_059264 [Elysia crispata]
MWMLIGPSSHRITLVFRPLSPSLNKDDFGSSTWQGRLSRSGSGHLGGLQTYLGGDLLVSSRLNPVSRPPSNDKPMIGHTRGPSLATRGRSRDVAAMVVSPLKDSATSGLIVYVCFY